MSTLFWRNNYHKLIIRIEEVLDKTQADIQFMLEFNKLMIFSNKSKPSNLIHTMLKVFMRKHGYKVTSIDIHTRNWRGYKNYSDVYIIISRIQNKTYKKRWKVSKKKELTHKCIK